MSRPANYKQPLMVLPWPVLTEGEIRRLVIEVFGLASPVSWVRGDKQQTYEKIEGRYVASYLLERLERMSHPELLGRMLAAPDDRQRTLIVLGLGLGRERPCNQAETAELVGIGTTAVQRGLIKAYVKMRWVAGSDW